jgi:uncharacterized protein YndB with AHSA1/START domain
MNKKIVTNSITINAPVSKVWDALINPEQTQKYMFGCKATSDWKPGSTLTWPGVYEGKEMVFVTGHVLEIEPERLLVYSVIDPNAPYEKTPENHLKVKYELRPAADATELIVSQYGFEEAADGEKRYTEISNNGEGWNPILQEIKKMLEQ